MINPRDLDPPTQHLPPRPPPANPLAVELRQIIDDNPHTTVARERLQRLVEHVEQLGVEPDVAELDAVAAGLDPEQEIRAQALQLSVDTWIGCRWGAEEPTAIIGLAVRYADWIRTGDRP